MLDPREFYHRLWSVGVDYRPVTIRKWAADGIIAGPRGRTRSAKWPEEAVGEAAAAYVLCTTYRVSPETIRRAIQIIREYLPGLRVLLPFREVSYELLAAATCAYWKGMRGIQLATPKRVTYWQRYDRGHPGNWRLQVEVTDSDRDELNVWADRQRAGQFDLPRELHFSVLGATADDMLVVARNLVTAGVATYKRVVSKRHYVADNRTEPTLMKTVESEHQELVAKIRTGRDLAVFHEAQIGMFLRTSKDRDAYVRGLKDFGIRVDLGPAEATENGTAVQRESRRRSGLRGSGKRAPGERETRTS